MRLKILISFLILSFLNLIGCYSVGEVTKDEFLKTKDRQVYLLTNDLEKYSFQTGNYIIRNDTLIGIGSKQFSGIGAVPFKGSLPLNLINLYQTEYLDGFKTLGLVLGIIGVGLLILSALFLASIDEIFHGD